MSTGAPASRILAFVILTIVVACVLGFRAGQASERDETVLTVEVSSADHEIMEGYFTLGDTATVMAKPGSDLFKFLSRQRGKKIRISLSEASKAELSRLER